MSRARLRYSGMVVFASRLISVVTGMLFTMIVTRRLGVEEFGSWQYVTVLLSYFIIPSNFTAYWITRDVARGQRLATTGLLLNFLFSVPAMMLFIVLSIPASEATELTPILLLVISPQICIMYLLRLFEAVGSGIEPHLVGYGLLVFEFGKICLGAFLVLNMRLGLMGAFLCVEIAYALQVIFMGAVLRKEFSRVFSIEAAKKWLMLMWIPLFSSLSVRMRHLDYLVATLVTGSTAPIAMLKAAQVFSTVVFFSRFAASALYPKLLAGGSAGDVEISIRLVSLLAIPSMAGAVVLAEPLLALLRMDYVDAAMALRISALTAVMTSVTWVSQRAILATETVDVSGRVDFRSYLRSRLALIPILGFVYDGVYLTAVFYIVSYLSATGSSPASIAAAMALTSLVVNIPLLVYKWILARRFISFKFPSRSVASYGIAAAAMTIVILSLNPSEVVATEIGKVIPGLVARIAVGGIIYLLLIYTLDEEPRIIAKRFLREIGIAKLPQKAKK